MLFPLLPENLSAKLITDERGLTDSEGLHFVCIEMLTLKKSSEQGAVDAFSIDIAVNSFNQIAVWLASLPYGERDEAFFPAHPSERKLGCLFVAHPICRNSQSEVQRVMQETADRVQLCHHQH